ncbi:MAG TPA: helix-turn-helix transcriptional regulator [Clostridiaceae bacterium]|nr:helix-turn-helix transcriptional regulator [Clostridiaceae bacterium]
MLQSLWKHLIIGIGSSRDLDNMHISYQEALDAIDYRVLSGESEVIHINNFDILGKTPKYFYPLHKEKALIDAIKLGNSEQAIKIIREVFNGIPKCAETASYIPEMLWQLMNGLFRGIYSMGIKYEDVFGKDFFDSYQEYRSKAKIEDMLQFIEDQVVCLTTFINNRRVYIKDNIIEKIKDYIKENYKENISLTDVASMVYMSPSYISFAFKEATGENFTEYLTKVRIEKAMDLLLCTESDIDTIASKVGYEPRSFLRAFKKYTGMTPTEYRKKMGLEALARQSSKPAIYSKTIIN